MNGANSKVYKAIIVGAGFAGMVAAITLAESLGGENVALSERNERVGKKLILTGNGQCNISNISVTTDRYHGLNSEFSKNALAAHGYESLKEFFGKLGVPLISDGDKVYPLSKQASAVLDALRLRLDYLKVNLFTGEKVVEAKKSVKGDDGEVFIVKTDSGKTLYGKNLLIASGGCVAPQTGSDGAGYTLAKSFGHSVTALYPSICKLPCDKNKIKGLAGIKQQAGITLKISGRAVANARGDVLFSKDAVSGNAAFGISSYYAGAKNGEAVIDFCPDMSGENLTAYLTKKLETCPYLTVAELFGGIINKKAAEAVIRNSTGINPLERANFGIIKSAAEAVKNFSVPLKTIVDFVGAQVTRGGVKTDDVNDNSMESKLVKNLYFAGEVLDVDGDCGGFNLQWAFSSATAFAESVIGVLK